VPQVSAQCNKENDRRTGCCSADPVNPVLIDVGPAESVAWGQVVRIRVHPAGTIVVVEIDSDAGGNTAAEVLT